MSETQNRTIPSAATAARRYASLLVHAEPELRSSPRVEVAARLAREFGARLIGLGAEALEPAPFADPYDATMMVEAVKQRTAEIERRLAAAEKAFLRDAAGADLEWRAIRTTPNDALADAARAADLVFVGALPRSASNYRTANPANVMLRAGRPVLIVPENGRHLRAEAVVIAWKDTREARRAIVDALPLLQRAETVVVQAIGGRDDLDVLAFQTNDVVGALKRQGVSAQAHVGEGRDDQVLPELYRIADAHQADLIVAGGYGRPRPVEWVFGGVTDDLLHRPRHFVLMSH